MIRLVKVLAAALLLWTLYWGVAAWGLRSGISNWFEQQQARGWQADFASLETSGYPARHVTRISQPALADPATGTAWQADWLETGSPAIWPGHQSLRFAPQPQRLSYFDRTVELTAADMQADLFLAPGSALEVERLALTSGPWQIEGPDGMLEAQSLELSMVQGEPGERYSITISADALAPNEQLHKLLAAAGDLPETLEAFELQAEITFDRAWDRRALEERRPQPRQIDLKLASAQWGDLQLQAAGSLTVDENGIPTGEIAIRAANWRKLLAVAEGTGALPPQLRNGMERILELLAGLGGRSEDLDVTLNFKNGHTALGPVPIGPAPQLILR